MIKTMIAKHKGRDARTGAPIYPGDEIKFDTVTRKAWLNEPGDFGSTDRRAFRFQPLQPTK